jgi:hypothetical protein
VVLKVNVKLSLCLIKHHAMKSYWGEGIAPRILELDCCEHGNEPSSYIEGGNFII